MQNTANDKTKRVKKVKKKKTKKKKKKKKKKANKNKKKTNSLTVFKVGNHFFNICMLQCDAIRWEQFLLRYRLGQLYTVMKTAFRTKNMKSESAGIFIMKILNFKSD